MAKRKRLTPANPTYLDERQDAASPAPSSGPSSVLPGTGMRAPIADIASDAATTAALRDVSDQMHQARQSGRMVAEIPLSQIDMDYLVRDRLVREDAEMDALIASIRERGQQTPVEVVELGPQSYGLISGWRRCHALTVLAKDSEAPATVLALLRKPASASDAYLAMIEENEIRVGLSYFERARIVVKAVEYGVFEDKSQALKSLFSTASRAKRSKIGSFVRVVELLDDALYFPQDIGERLGLSLSKALTTDPTLYQSLLNAFKAHPRPTPEAEQAIISQVLATPMRARLRGETGSNKAKRTVPSEQELRPGLKVRVNQTSGAVTISGEAMTPDLREELLSWLQRKV